MALVTVFSTPKAFKDGHISTIQRNAIASWARLAPEVEVILVGDDEGVDAVAAEFGVKYLPNVERNEKGTPMVNSIFDLARGATDSPLLCYVNADILLLPDFVEAAKALLADQSQFLAIGQRWDIDLTEPFDFSGDWGARLEHAFHTEGKLHPPAGSDYFLYPRSCFQEMPAFAIGRAGWDNWMIYFGRVQGWKVIDCTKAITIGHQNHDYRHLPGGVAHYRLPESDQNVRAGGGFLTIFPMTDANWRLVGGKLARRALSWRAFWREVEIFPLVTLHSQALGKVFYYLFHPKAAWLVLKEKVSRVLRRAE